MFKVELENGTVITWDKGKYKCDDEKVLNRLRACGHKISQMRAGVYLHEVCLASGVEYDYEKNRFTAFALINNVARIKKASGDVPTLEEIYGKPEENVVN